MFIGHFAPALVAAARPKAAGLGTLFVAAQLVDIGFAALLIPGVEAMRIVPGITAMKWCRWQSASRTKTCCVTTAC